MPPATGPRSMERLLTGIAAMVAGCVAVLLPALTATVGLSSLGSILQTEAEINSRLVSRIINANPELWKAETARLEEVLRRQPSDRTPENRLVADLDGAVVSQVRAELDAPLLERTAPVHDAGTVVGTIRVQRSLRPLVVQSAWVGALGVLLGTIVFVVLRVLPLRALRSTQDRLLHEATHDGLTGLPNRVLFRDRLEQAMRRAQQTRRPMALMFMDLDNFKTINDGLGHAFGDQVLRHVAAVMQGALAQGMGPSRRRNDGASTVARLGGDEFTAIVESAGTTHDTAGLADRILDALRRPVVIEGRELELSGSIGIAMYPQDNTDLDLLLRQADMALYRAKDLGRNTHHFFNEELNRSIQQRISMEQDLRGALDRREFLLHYQPKATLDSHEITGVEALLRWQRPGEGLVPPDRFIRILEESALIIPVGSWVLDRACAQLAAWDRQGLPPLSLSVNLSARQFRDPGLPGLVSSTLARHGLAAHRIELEITETLLMDDNDLSQEILVALARIGVRVAIDDFGTGHSSLSYLKRFKVNTLKIDRSFLRDVPNDADNCAIASAVAALAHSLGLSVVSEGVERVEQLEFLQSIDCDEVQGYLIGRPMPPEDVPDWLARYHDDEPELTAWHEFGSTPAPRPAPRLRAVPTR